MTGAELDALFREAVTAIDAGDVASLEWFVTEDAVRTGQLSANVGAIARTIIEAARRTGAADLEHQLDSTFHFAVCSPIGRDDGRQLELLDVLIDAGAAIEGGPVEAFICSYEAAATISREVRGQSSVTMTNTYLSTEEAQALHANHNVTAASSTATCPPSAPSRRRRFFSRARLPRDNPRHHR